MWQEERKRYDCLSTLQNTSGPWRPLEPPRVFRRLRYLRGWNHEYIKTPFFGARERAVRLVREVQQENSSQLTAIQSISAKIGCTDETLRRWVCQAEADHCERAGLTSDNKALLKRLPRDSRELKQANEILHKASVFFRPGGARLRTVVMVSFIDTHREIHEVESISRQLPIAPSTCYEIKVREADPSRMPPRAGGMRSWNRRFNASTKRTFVSTVPRKSGGI